MSAHVADPYVAHAHVAEDGVSQSLPPIDAMRETQEGREHSDVDRGASTLRDGDAVLAPIEAALQRGVEACKNNPTLTVLGVASVAALIVLSAKASSRKSSPPSDLESRVASALASQRRVGSDLVDMLSAAIARAVEASPAEMSEFGKLTVQWINKARQQISNAVSSVSDPR